ncbi:hypothetical protein [Devosia submarina]|uniref:hypothetical protein n=1 Tax=Devosia submarina TaxID=1173082 RepID=UPI000D3C923C|nr:hypothetical protein [Devosia submarina]
MHQDSISETIAHFIGLFETQAEIARLRHGYDEFSHVVKNPNPEPLPDAHSPLPRQVLELTPNNPLIEYTPEATQAHVIASTPPLAIKLMPMRMPEPDWSPKLPSLMQGASPGVPVEPTPLIGPVPGSVGMIVAQYVELSDNDVVVIGGYSGPLPNHQHDNAALNGMIGDLDAFSAPLTDLSSNDIFHTIPEFMAAAADAAMEMAQYQAPGMSVSSAVGSETQGTHVNGEQVTELPVLEDWLPPEPSEEAPVTTGSVSLQTGDDSITVATGNNVLANQATIIDAGLAPAIVAVLGDHFQLDLIAQANAFIDIDHVDAGFPGASTGGATAAFNIASFTNNTLDAQGAAIAANPEAMPTNWTVSILEGDLVFLQWVAQYTFASDNDLVVMTATGSTTNIDTGNNGIHNDLSFANLGLYYDIVIIGGNLYDANLICQTNILYDNDTLQMLADAQLSGSSETSGNLLWNQASILKYGPQGSTGALPDHYSGAAEALGRGDLGMPDGFSGDPALAGLGHLRVLYVTGNVYDLRYVEQTNVLTDADTLAVYAQGAEALAGSEWTVSTGQNALTNIASIVDYASASDTFYVGGGSYSDAVLIQADLMDATSSSATGLPNELVAFLEQEPALQVTPDFYHAPISHADSAPADVMQSVLA